MRKKKPKRGRPAMEKGLAKQVMMTLRLREEDRSDIEAAAEADGVPVSEWVRRGLLTLISQRTIETGR